MNIARFIALQDLLVAHEGQPMIEGNDASKAGEENSKNRVQNYGAFGRNNAAMPRSASPDGKSILASTLIWTGGVKPSSVVASLPLQKVHGRVLVTPFLSVPQISGLWAAGDCAAVPVANGGGFHPATAQHGVREG
jgi:hypothetical protein